MRPRIVPTFVSIIKYWITMEKKKGLLSKIFSNTRKPEGFFGRLMVASGCCRGPVTQIFPFPSSSLRKE